MELITIDTDNQIIEENDIVSNEKSAFIEANTIKVDLEHLKNECIVPVFAKDNELTISHSQFIESVKEVVQELFVDNQEIEPQIRVSHVIKGRVPSAIGKSVSELKEDEKTIYYERMAFLFELPIVKEIGGNKLSLCVGGVRAYNQENLFSKKSLERIKLFIGFKNKICTNLCINTDGLKSDVKIYNVNQIKDVLRHLILGFDIDYQINNLSQLSDYYLTEDQLAYLIGKLKFYPFLSKEQKKEIFPVSINDTQINSIVKDYYNDINFCGKNGKISLWDFYNLCTEANKSTYIDTNLEKNVSMYSFSEYLLNSVKIKESNFFVDYNNIAFL